MKDAVDLLNQRISELEKSLHGSSLELISRSKRITELEADHRDCLQTITDMQSKWEEVQAENGLLREGLASLSNRFDKGLEYDAEENHYILVWTQRELDVAKRDAEKLRKELGWDKFDVAMEGE